ncbi:hypothetical protein [Candidatus Palauibacter sp.]|uniref:hypothetical protein n=1 Tax=Candidatus Palauibacter sp. TaxID=3101350 RepID=UPI003B516389
MNLEAETLTFVRDSEPAAGDTTRAAIETAALRHAERMLQQFEILEDGPRVMALLSEAGARATTSVLPLHPYVVPATGG